MSISHAQRWVVATVAAVFVAALTGWSAVLVLGNLGPTSEAFSMLPTALALAVAGTVVFILPISLGSVAVARNRMLRVLLAAVAFLLLATCRYVGRVGTALPPRGDRELLETIVLGSLFAAQLVHIALLSPRPSGSAA